LAAEIESKRPDAAIEFIGEEDAPGTFNVVAEGVELWNKHARGGFPKQAEIEEIIEKLPPPREEPSS